MNKKNLPVCALLAMLAFSSHAIPPRSELTAADGLLVVRAIDIAPEHHQLLQDRFDVWAIDRNDRYAVIGIHSSAELSRLQQLGFTVYTDPVTTSRYRALASRGGNGQTIPGFPCYRTVEETYLDAEQLVADQPDLAEIIDIGDSWEKTEDPGTGYDLRVLRLTNRGIAGDKPILFVMSAIHPREYATAETMTRFAEQLVNGYGVRADATWLLDHHEIHLLLQANPDGRKIAENNVLWRKNTNSNYCMIDPDARGADLNRNFPFEWGGAASTDECATTYQGPTPSSEPEVTSVVDYVRTLFPDQRGDGVTDPAPLDATGVFIDVHSFSELVLWPWGYSFAAGSAPNQPQLSTLGRRLTFFNGYTPQQILGLTAASGSTADFAYGELGVASFAFEIGTTFFQDCGSFESTIAPDNIDALWYAAKVARTPYQTPSGPDVPQLELSPSVVLPGAGVDIQIQADGTRFGTVPDSTSPQEPARLIAGVEIYIDAPPWDGNSPIGTTPDDGNFDTAVESASVSVDTAGFTEGRHVIYAQAIGMDNQAGAVTASFLHILNPATAGGLAGQVLVQGTSTTVAGARIEVGAFETTSNASGQYALDLPPDTYSIQVSAEGFGSTQTTTTIDPLEQEILDLAVIPRCQVLFDDVESGNMGWMAQAPWAISDEAASSPTHAWHDSPGGSYQNNLDITLTSPPMDLSERSEAELTFNHICNTEAGFDFGIVETSSDGNAWTEVYRCDDQESWQQQTIDLASLDGSGSAQIRFRLQSDSIINDDGWTLDDIVVSGLCPAGSGDSVFANGFE